ncbi:mini-chromosome maintenance replisome factor-domain-containing protein [Paraphysoderma sedebokerense]|nr:mini-chromosome maintenance replisome factor-domain-containing protein [Paraphysoderma sedebokerense]
MSASDLHAAINSPRSLIDVLFDRASANGPVNGSSSFGIPEYFKQMFQANETKKQIPVVNVTTFDQLPNLHNRLVRFRCMVQDNTFPVSPYFVAMKGMDADGVEKMRCLKYTDEIYIDPNEYHEAMMRRSHPTFLSEKAILYGVSVPGETNWVQNHLYGSSMKSNEMSTDQMPELISDEYKSRKFPLPTTSHHSVYLKFYDSNVKDSLGIGQVIDVYGILEHEGTGEMDCCGNGNIDLEESDHHLLHSSEIPKIHVIWHEVESKILDPEKLVHLDDCEQRVKQVQQQLPEIRNKLVQYLTTCTNGDIVVAEYLLLHLISSIYRRDPVMHLGSLSLNIMNCPISNPSNRSEFSHRLSQLISLLTPKSVTVPLSLQTLNNEYFMNRSYGAMEDESAAKAENNGASSVGKKQNKLKDVGIESGMLHVSDRTFLVVDELALTEGKVNGRGIANLRTLQTLIQFQSLEYLFPYYASAFKMEVDLPVLVLSESKSLLHGKDAGMDMVMLPMKQNIELAESCDESMIDGDLLELFRLFLLVVVKNVGEIEIREEMMKSISDYFVSERKAIRESASQKPLMSHDYLSYLIGLARLHSVSLGANQLQPESWSSIISLESERQKRLDDITMERGMVKAVDGLSVKERNQTNMVAQQ